MRLTTREILFKGKRKDNGEWVVGDLSCGVNDDSVYVFPGGVDEGVYHYAVFPTTVGQYTEQKDRHGTKIFEDDVIVNIENGRRGRVCFMPELSMYAIYCKAENQYYNLWDMDFKKVEVVGNIHDDPYLIDRKGSAENAYI